MLIADDLDELELLRARYLNSQSNNKSLALTLVPSFGCNFDCPYCFEDKHPSVMNENIQEAVLRLVDDRLSKIDQLTISWFGGSLWSEKRPSCDYPTLSLSGASDLMLNIQHQ